MQALVRAALRDGAIGFTSRQLDLHVAHDGRGVPTNHAAPEELIALASVLGEFGRGAIEFIPRTFLTGYDDDDRDADPRDGARVGPAGAPQHAHAAAARARRLVAQPRVRGVGGERRARGPPDVRDATGRARTSRSARTFLFDEMPSFRDTLDAARAAARRSAARSRACASRCARRSPTRPVARSCSSGRSLRVETVAEPEHERCVGRTRHRDRRRAWAGPARRVPRPLARRGPRDAVRARGAARREAAGRDRDDDPRPARRWPAAPTAARTCSRSAAPTTRPGCSPSGCPTCSRSRRRWPGSPRSRRARTGSTDRGVLAAGHGRRRRC